MMAGGVEFNHYFVEKKLPMPELARFICFTFILIMSISLMNLLVSKYRVKCCLLSLGLYLVLINRAGGLYGKILTEVLSTDLTQ